MNSKVFQKKNLSEFTLISSSNIFRHEASNKMFLLFTTVVRANISSLRECLQLKRI